VVFLTAALLLGGVSVIFYPLKSLAIDQETKAMCTSCGVSLVDLLEKEALKQLKKQSMIISCCHEHARDEPLVPMLTAKSLRTLQKETAALCDKDLVKGVCLDEAHLVPADGQACWAESLKANELLLKKLKSDVRVVLATATCTLTTCRDIQKKAGVKIDDVTSKALSAATPLSSASAARFVCRWSTTRGRQW
jgi:superfamily II DNA helicase RecQ